MNKQNEAPNKQNEAPNKQNEAPSPNEAPNKQNGAPSPEEFLVVLDDIYEQVKRVHRTIRMEDDLARGLNIDSLDVLEMLVSIEERYGVALVDSPAVAQVETVCDLYTVVTGQLGFSS